MTAKIKNKCIALLSVLLVLLITFAFVALTGCGGNKNSDPIEVSGESTVIETVSGSPAKLSATDVAYAYLGKQKNFSSYRSVTEGTTTAQKGIIKYEQKVSNKAYKNGDEYYEDSSSNSLFVNMRHQVFVKGGKAVYRNSSKGALNVSEKAAYKQVYGISPDDVALGGYILNAESIKFAEKMQEDGDQFTYRYVLNASAGDNAVKQMKEFGSLNGYPTFNSLTLYFTIKSDWTPVKLIVESNYNISVSVLGSLTCDHDFTTEFFDVKGKVEIPSTEEFNAELGTTPTPVVGGESEKSPIMKIAEDFTELDYNTGVHFGIDLSGLVEQDLGFMKLTLPLESASDLYLKIDKQAIADKDYLNCVKLRLDLDVSKDPLGTVMSILPGPIPELKDMSDIIGKMKKVSVYYIGDGKLYITFTNSNQQIRKIVTVNLVDVLLSALNGDDEADTEESSFDIKGLISSLIKPNGTDGEGTSSLDLMEIISGLTEMFDVTRTETGTTFVLKKDFVVVLNSLFSDLFEGLASSLGEMSQMLAMFKNEISGFEIKTTETEGKVTAISLEIKSKKEDAATGESTEYTFVGLSVSIEGNLTDELDDDGDLIEAVLADEKAAKPIRDMITFLKDNMWLGDTYVECVTDLSNAYKNFVDNGLTPAQKALISNWGIIGSDSDSGENPGALLRTHNSLKAQADNFIKMLETIDTWTDAQFKSAAETFSGLEDCQLKYIGEENIQKYLEAVADHFKSMLDTVDSWTDKDFTAAAGIFEQLNDEQKEQIGEENINKYLEAVEEHEKKQSENAQ